MAITKFLARDLDITVTDAGSGGGGIEIKGLHTLTHAPSSTDTDITDFDSDGHAEHFKAERGETWTLAGFALMDVVTGDRDPGQALVEQLAQERGMDSYGTFVITDPAGKTITFNATCEVTLHGGGHNDAAAWQAILHVSGASAFA